MALKYQIQFNSQKYGIDYLLHIFRADYTGDVIYLNAGAASVVLRKDSDGILRGTSLDISLEVPTTNPWGLPDLYSEHDRQHKVVLYRGGEIYFSGYLASEEYADELIDPPFDITVRAVDGIGTLKNFDYSLPNDAALVSAKDIVFHCLNKLDLGIGLMSCLYVYANGFNTSQSPLAQTYLRRDAFYDSDDKPLKCDEVLSLLLQSFDPNVYVTQYKNRWEISRTIDLINTLNASGSQFDIFDPDGTYASRSRVPNYTDFDRADNYADNKCFAIGSLSRQILAQPKTITLEQDYGLLDNAIKWGKAKKDPGTGTVGAFTNVWSTVWYYPTGGTPTFDDIYIWHKGSSHFWEFNALGLGTTYYKHINTLPVLATTNDVVFTFRARANSTFTFSVKIKLGSYYLSATGWTTTPSKLTFTNIAEGTDFTDLTVTADGFPTSGNVEIEIGECLQKVFISEVVLTFIDQYDAELPSSQTSIVDIQPNSRSEESIDCYGQTFIDPNSPIIYKNGFLSSTGAVLSEWKHLTDSAWFSLLGISARSLASNYRATRQKISGTVMGMDHSAPRLIRYAANNNRIFTVDTVSHDLRADTFEIEMTELLPYQEPASVTIQNTQNY